MDTQSAVCTVCNSLKHTLHTGKMMSLKDYFGWTNEETIDYDLYDLKIPMDNLKLGAE